MLHEGREQISVVICRAFYQGFDGTVLMAAPLYFEYHKRADLVFTRIVLLVHGVHAVMKLRSEVNLNSVR